MTPRSPQSSAVSCRPEVRTLVEYIAGKTVEEVQRELGLRDIVKLSSNENPLGPSPRVRDAILDCLPRIATYPERSFLALKTSLADANNVSVDNICVGHGSETIIQIIPQMCVTPGDEVVVAAATYGRYEEASKLMGGRPIRVPLRALRHDLEAMAASVTERTRIVWICNPNNPTGTHLRADEVGRFLESIPCNVLVVFDQAYVEYADDPAFADAVAFLKAGYENVVVLRTFSKVHGLAGLRLGYGIAAAPIRKLLDTIKEPFNLNRFSIAAGPAALADTAWTARCIEQNRQGRGFLATELKGMGFDPAESQANFVLVDVKQDADELFERLLRRGVIVRSAAPWGLTNYIRVTVGTAVQNERFLATLAEVAS
ncbi:MAG: histidinol-phosphate transaminase [Actinomycetes bacterium]